MARPGPSQKTERERLIFGAGFAFGVMFTLLILAVVLAAVLPESVTPSMLLSSTVLLPIVSAIVFAFVVGIALYVLALPDQGFGLPQYTVFGDAEPDNPDVEN